MVLHGVTGELLCLGVALKTAQHFRKVVLRGGNRLFRLDAQTEERFGRGVVTLLQTQGTHHVVCELVMPVAAENRAGMALSRLSVIQLDV